MDVVARRESPAPLSQFIDGGRLRLEEFISCITNFLYPIHTIYVLGFQGVKSSGQAQFWRTMQTIERRTQRRLPLRWPVRLSVDGIGPIEAWTRELSASSFYCIVNTPLVPGQKIDCDLTVPASGRGNPTSIGSIECQTEVVRVEVLGPGQGFGIAFRIIAFTFSHTRGGSNG
jgi:hypothetical protein